MLPFLPGNTFPDLGRKSFRKSHMFDYRNGLPVVDAANLELPADDDDVRMATAALSTMGVGESSSAAPAGAKLSFDRKVLRFYGFFRESVHESPLESQRLRRCIIYYYLEDETLHVSEPKIDNSGIPQGPLIKRHRVPKVGDTRSHIRFRDLAIGSELVMYGKTFRVTDCDGFTRRFLEAAGMAVPEPETFPEDAYTETRQKLSETMAPLKMLNDEDAELKRYLEYSFKGRHCAPSRDQVDACKKFLAKDRRVLRFYCSWDDRASLYGDFRLFVLTYFLADDTVEVTELDPANSGRDPFPVFLRRSKVPKRTSDGTTQFYTEADLKLGEYINLNGRALFLYDCDQYTKMFYAYTYGIQDMDPVASGAAPSPDLTEASASRATMIIPPHDGIGSEEDTLGNVKYLVLKPPKRDFKKLMEHDRDVLRFGARFEDPKIEDAERKFIISYYLADDTIAIYEPPQRNSGIIGGKFLQRQRVKTEDRSRFIEAKDFYIGCVIVINRHKLFITETDDATLKFMESRPREFSLADVNAILRKLRQIILSRHVRIRDAFLDIDRDHSGAIQYNEFSTLMRSLGFDLIEQELITLMRHFDRDRDGQVSYLEFCERILPKEGRSEIEGKLEGEEIAEQASVTSEFDKAQKRRDEEVKRAHAFKLFKEKMNTRRLYFHDVFRILSDRSPDSLIGEKEFKSALNDNLQMNFEDDEAMLLTRMFFPNSRKRLSLPEFKVLLDSSSSWALSYNQ